MKDAAKFDEWCIVELLGHRKLGARVTEATIAGAAFLRLDVPGVSGDVATQFVSPGAIYAITPVSEDLARRVAAGHRPEPVTRWELPAPQEPFARIEYPPEPSRPRAVEDESEPPASCSSCGRIPCDCEIPY